MKNKSLKLNAFLNGLRSVSNLIFPLITFPYISRVLSVSGVGINNFSATYVGYFVLVAGLGISTYAVREGAKYRNNSFKFNEFASQVFTINIWSTIIAYLMLFFTLIMFQRLSSYVICILIFSIQIIFTTLGTEWVYIIYEDFSYITVRSIIFKFISLILMFVFVRRASDYLNYALITVFATVGSNILNYFHAKSFCALRLVNNMQLRKHLKPIMLIFASSAAVSVYVSSDVTILGLLKGNNAVGLYNVPVRIYTISKSLLSAILAVTIPRLSMLYGQNKMLKYKIILKKLLNVLNILVFPMTIGIIVLSKDIILLIAGEKYKNSELALSLISFGVIFCIFNWVFSDCVLIPAKRESFLLRNTVITAMFNIIMNIILIPYTSYNGSALSTSLSEGVAMILNYYCGKDILKNVIFNKEFSTNLLSVIVGCAYIIGICMVIRMFSLILIVELIVSIILSVVGYFIILFALRNKIIIFYANILQEKFIKKSK